MSRIVVFVCLICVLVLILALVHQPKEIMDWTSRCMSGFSDFQQGMFVGGVLMFFAGYFSVDPLRGILNRRRRTEKPEGMSSNS